MAIARIIKPNKPLSTLQYSCVKVPTPFAVSAREADILVCQNYGEPYDLFWMEVNAA